MARSRGMALFVPRRLVDAETARSAFAAFAQKCGILMPDTEPVIAAQATGRFGRLLPT